MPVKLNKETHTYTVDGVEKPGVSEIMRPLSEEYYKMATKYGRMETARNRGEAVHRAVDFYLTYGIFDKEYSDYVNAFAQWMIDESIEVIHNEHILTNGQYCGTTDLLVRSKGKIILVDMKATSVINMDLLEVQLAGYYNLYLANGVQVDETWVLQLKPNKYVYKPVAINQTKWKELYEAHTHQSDLNPERG